MILPAKEATMHDNQQENGLVQAKPRPASLRTANTQRRT